MDAMTDELRRAFFELGNVAPEVACIICCVAEM